MKKNKQFASYAKCYLRVVQISLTFLSFAICADEFEILQKQAIKGEISAQYKLANCYYYGRGINQDYSKAVHWYKKAADKNNSIAQFNLALCYDLGLGIKKDKLMAFKYYKLASRAKIPQATFNVAITLLNGIKSENNTFIIKPNLNKSLDLFIDLHKNKFLPAYYYLANIYLSSQNYNKAITILKDATRQNDLKSIKLLADIYFSNKNYKDSIHLLKKGVKLEDAESASKLAYCYLTIQKNENSAIELLEYASNKDFAPAQFALGDYYSNVMSDNFDIAKAIELYKKAASQNNIKALNKLALFATEGIGQDKNSLLGSEYYFKSAKLGSSTAQFALGKLYKNGITKDMQKALYWFEQASEEKAMASREVAYCYLNGTGCKKNIKKAIFYLERAAQQGDKHSANVLKNIKSGK